MIPRSAVDLHLHSSASDGVLGLAIDPCAAALVRGLCRLQELRESRAERIALRLSAARAPGRKSLAAIRASARLPTRTHFARALVAFGAAAGGKAVIAHPMRYPLSAGARRELCREFPAAGGRGIEVVTGGGGIHARDQAISLAVRSRLEGSVGSDFHDPATPWNPPGRLAKLPGSVRPVWSAPPFPVLETSAEPA